MTGRQHRGIRVDAEMKLERLEGTTCVQTVLLSTQNDGTVTLSCSGKFPSTTWKQVRELRARVREFVEFTGQDLLVTCEGDLLVRVVHRPNQGPKVSVRWLGVARQLFGLNK